MAKQLQLRRGTTLENNSFVGAVGELTYDTEKNGMRLHDGSTVGGHEVPVLVAVQRPTAENGYTWYRKYSDGWVEQGGNAVNKKPATITLPVEMADTNYTLIATGFLESRTNTNGARWSDVTVWINSTTTITMGGTTLGMCWEVKGIAA